MDFQDKELISAEIADYFLEDRILVSLSKNPKRSVENIKRNVALVKKITNNKSVLLLIYLSNSTVLDKETREFSTTKLPIIYTAIAIISRPGLSKIIMNILFSF